MAYSRRSYKGAAVANALASGTLAAGSTSITLASAMVGWPTGSNPFFVVVDPGTSKEEKVCVIYNTATTLTVVSPTATSGWSASSAGRGCDDTQDRQHDGGAVIYPVFTSIEANQANELVSKYTTNGDLVVHGSTGFKTVSTGGAGNNNKVLIADSTITDGGVKWGQIVEAGIADDAVTAAKIAAGAVGESELAANAVTSGKIADGTIVNADISASAAIALSKLATGALPTDITVASANIVNGTIVADDLASSSVTNAKLDYTTVPQITVSSSNPTGGKNGDIWIVV